MNYNNNEHRQRTSRRLGENNSERNSSAQYSRRLNNESDAYTSTPRRVRHLDDHTISRNEYDTDRTDSLDLRRPRRNAGTTPSLSPRHSRDTARNHTASKRADMHNDELSEGKTLLLMIFFPLCFLYFELLLKLFSGDLVFGNFGFILLFSLSYGFVTYLICSLFRSRKAVRFMTILTLIAVPVIFLIQYFCREFFTFYMSLAAIFGTAGMMMRSYFTVAVLLVLRGFYVVILYFVPLIVYIFFFKGKPSSKFSPVVTKIFPAGAAVVCFLVALLFVNIIPGGVVTNKEYYTSEFSITETSGKFGLMTGMRLDLKYLIFGTPKAAPSDIKPIDPVTPETDPSKVDPEPSGSGTESSSMEPPVVYGDNAMDIDFASLIANEKDDHIKEMHQYFASQTPTKKNQYTGIFKDKNVIVLTAEAFSWWAIDKDLTPTLYKMQTEGIYFTNFYQPAWGYSTSDGEYSHLLGLIPKSGKESMYQSRKNNLYFTVGNQTQRLGYFTRAYHDNTYTYYKRNETHENLGYEKFIAVGNGLEGLDKVWPKSDLQMMEHTVDEYINNQPFSIYYMTVSGHANYSWSGNMMSYRNRDAVAHLNHSEPVAAYLACNLELEKAMTYLIDRLEQAGIADDTVIVMVGDHYPYGLEGPGKEEGDQYKYLNELAGEKLETNVGIHRNACIIWSGCLKDYDPIQVDDPCYSIDILPTVSNLFGFEYDSRLLAGRDALSDSEPFVVFRNYSWISDKGYYNHKNETFYPNEGVTVDNEYIKAMSKKAKDKVAYSRYILEEDYYSKIFGKKK